MVSGWSIYKKQGPEFIHDCDECKFLFTVKFKTYKGEKAIDVYQQCSKDEAEYLFRFSSLGADYASGFNLDRVLALAARRFVE